MAITFDPVTKIIQLDTFTASAKQLWTAFVDWAILDDNLKYGVGMLQIGGKAPVAMYIYLDLEWKIRPVEDDGVTTITGNVLTTDGSSPMTATLGNYNVLVNMETPLQAAAIEINTGSGLTDAENAKLMSIPTAEETAAATLDFDTECQ